MDMGYIGKLLSLEGKKAIVTGGSQGIGRATAISLASFGADVMVLGRNESLLAQTEDIIHQKGGRCKGYSIDLTDWEKVDDFFDSYIRTNGKLDIFINNAGYTVTVELADTSREDIEGLLETNVKSAVHCLSQAANIMKSQKCGNIVVITSVNGLNAHPGHGMYSVTKYALEGAMKALASTMAPYGVRVNSCAPGAIDTAMNAGVLSDNNKTQEVIKKIPLHRIGLPEDIGDAVSCMVSDAFRYMTGSTIVVDGGMMLKSK